DDFRIRICRQAELRAELERAGQTVKWGKYLRAPEVFLEILAEKKLCPLFDLEDVEFGGTSGINEFYYMTPQEAEERGIEPEFLRPLLKSPSESNFIIIDRKNLELRVFVCRKTKAELRAAGKTGALKYIEWGEKQTFKSGALAGHRWPEGAEVRERKPGW